MNKPKNTSDAELVIAFQKGDHTTISILVTRWHQQFCKQAYWYTKDKEAAKDVAQNSWKVIIEKLETLKDPDKFGYWALAIVCRKAIDWTRKKNSHFQKLKDYQHTFKILNEETAASYSIPKVLQAIQSLPENQQQVIRLFYLEAYSLKQISNTLNISKGTVKSRLFYAREQLKFILKTKNYEN